MTAFTHTKTSGKVNNGFNQWDEQYEGGTLNDNTGLPLPNASSCRSKNYCECFENTAYYVKSSIRTDICWYGAGYEYITKSKVTQDSVITSKPGAKYFKLCFPSNTTPGEVCINLHWDGERDGEYEPYQEWNYPVEDIELKGILSLDAQDNWVADGDEYLPDGTVVENYAVDTVAVQSIYDREGNENIRFAILTLSEKYIGKFSGTKAIAKTDDMTYDNCTQPYYIFGYSQENKQIAISVPVGTNLAGAQALLDGSKVQYKLATSTTSSADSYTELQNDSNWGTEKWIDTRDVPLPVFSTCEYIPDLKAKVETAPESPDEDGDYIMHRENGLNSYGSLSTWLSANGYNKLQDLLTAFGANGMVGGALRQTLAKAKNIDFLNTGCLDMGNITWEYYSSSTSTFRTTVRITGADYNDGTNVPDILTTKYQEVAYSTTLTDKWIKMFVSSNTYQIIIKDTSYDNNLTGFNADIKGQLLAYKKAST